MQDVFGKSLSFKHFFKSLYYFNKNTIFAQRFQPIN